MLANNMNLFRSNKAEVRVSTVVKAAKTLGSGLWLDKCVRRQVSALSHCVTQLLSELVLLYQVTVISFEINYSNLVQLFCG
jgi:hypothetical protein